jgi:transketolase
MHTLKPLDVPLIKKYAQSCSHIFTLEEHSVIGGLGSAVAEVLAESGFKGHFRRIGIPSQLLDINGNSLYLRGSYGLLAKQIYMKIIKDIH